MVAVVVEAYVEEGVAYLGTPVNSFDEPPAYVARLAELQVPLPMPGQSYAKPPRAVPLGVWQVDFEVASGLMRIDEPDEAATYVQFHPPGSVAGGSGVAHCAARGKQGLSPTAARVV